MRPPAFSPVWCFLFIIGCATPKALNTSNTKSDDVRSAISAKHYIFKARTALPTGGRSRQLTSEYDLRVTGDTLVAYLPYFGRAYTAPIDPSKGGIQFTSVKFDYTATEGGKRGWTIKLKPQDSQDVSEFNLTISEEGYASLQVNSVNRQPISFTGFLEPYDGAKK